MEGKRQEINSLLDRMDEDSLDWLLSIIKLRIKKEEKIKYIEYPDDKEIWDKVCELIALELTEVSYITWIKDIVPIGIEEDLIKLAIKNEFHKDIIEKRYTKLIKNALLLVTDRKFELEYFVGV